MSLSILPQVRVWISWCHVSVSSNSSIQVTSILNLSTHVIDLFRYWGRLILKWKYSSDIKISMFIKKESKYSGRTLKLCITFVPVIRTSKHFWLLQCIWHQTMVIYPWCITTCSHWNHCIWSQELWEHKFLVFKNGLLFYRFMVEWVSFLHKMTLKGLIAITNQTILTISQP